MSTWSRLKLGALAFVGAEPTVMGRVSIPGKGRVRIGSRVRLDGRAAPLELNAHGGADILIGADVSIGPGASVEALGSITIGDRVELGPFCKVLDSHFHPLRGYRHQRQPSMPVVIEHDAVIGERTIILAGARVAAGTRVPPGEVIARRGRVTMSLPPPAPDDRSFLARVALLAKAPIRLARARYLFGAASAGKRIYASGFVRVAAKGSLVLGNGVVFLGGMIPTEIFCRPGATLSIGTSTLFNYGASVSASECVHIGRNCLIASMVRICDRDGAGTRPILIGDGVWLAHGVVVRPGVKIGDDSVIAAGSVVFDDVPPQSLAAGNPARAVPLDLVAPSSHLGPNQRETPQEPIGSRAAAVRLASRTSGGNGDDPGL